MIHNNKNRQLKKIKNTNNIRIQIHVKNPRQEKLQQEKKEIHYIKRSVQDGRVTSGYSISIIIISLKLNIIIYVYMRPSQISQKIS